MLSQIEEFVNWLRRRSQTALTWRDYGYDLKQFAAAVENRPPDRITFKDIDRFILSQVEKGFGPATINRRLAAIMSFYVYLSDEYPHVVCPVKPRRHLLREPKRLPRPVEDVELEAFFAAIDDSTPEGPRDRAMFVLMLRCGLRIGEVAALLLTDLYLDESRPRLVARGKGSRERSTYLSPQAVRAFRAYLKLRPTSSSDFVFLSYKLKGLSTTAIHYRLLRYREKAEVNLSAHRLRHSFAMNLLEAGVPVTSIQKLLGHRWLETTQNYVEAKDPQVQADYYAACGKIEGWAGEVQP